VLFFEFPFEKLKKCYKLQNQQKNENKNVDFFVDLDIVLLEATKIC